MIDRSPIGGQRHTGRDGRSCVGALRPLALRPVARVTADAERRRLLRHVREQQQTAADDWTAD